MFTESAYVPVRNHNCLVCGDKQYDLGDNHIKTTKDPVSGMDVEVVDIAHPKPGVITLACGHTYCVNCIKGWEEGQGQLKVCMLHCLEPVMRILFPKEPLAQLFDHATEEGRRNPVKAMLVFSSQLLYFAGRTALFASAVSSTVDAVNASLDGDFSDAISLQLWALVAGRISFLLCEWNNPLCVGMRYLTVAAAAGLAANAIAVFHVVSAYPLHAPLRSIYTLMGLGGAWCLGMPLPAVGLALLAEKWPEASLPENSRWRYLGGAINRLVELIRSHRLLEAIQNRGIDR